MPEGATLARILFHNSEVGDRGPIADRNLAQCFSVVALRGLTY